MNAILKSIYTPYHDGRFFFGKYPEDIFDPGLWLISLYDAGQMIYAIQQDYIYKVVDINRRTNTITISGVKI